MREMRYTRYCSGMSQENVELVRSVYADPRGLTAGASGKVAPDAEFDFSAVYPDSPIVRGVEELRRFRDSGPWSGSSIHFEPERFFDVDDERVLVFVRVSATGQGSGAQVENRVAHEFTIRDDLVVRFKVYESRDQALDAAGLRQ
jgi:ketosteroid isomerase-like protein